MDEIEYNENSRDLYKTPATVWQQLSTDYVSLVTTYDWTFSMDWDDFQEGRMGIIKREWAYQTYIALINGGRQNLGRHTSQVDAKQFHEEMVIKHGFK